MSFVSLEWLRGKTTMRGGATPYVGLRAPTANAVGVALRHRAALRGRATGRKAQYDHEGGT